MIAMVWGRPAGIISILFGLFALVGTFMPEKATPQDQEQGEEA
jgi:hypothetical protein